MTGKSVLSARSLTKSFNRRRILSDISLHINQGEVIGLLGPNGAGKTTTFRLLLGFLEPERGSVILNGRDITRDPAHKRARYGMSYLPQEPSIFRHLTVYENIQAIRQMLPAKKKSIDPVRVIGDMGLGALINQKAYQLSGGERRRLEIARAMLLSPDFLLLDEPFAGIDPIQISEIQKLILQLKERKLGVIITDHNVREILKITDRSYIINRGQIIFDGDSQSLIRDRRVQKEYLGHQFTWN